MKKTLLTGTASLLGRPTHARTTGRWLQRLLLAAAVLLPALGQAQTTVATENFEGTNSFTIVNGSQVNKWFVGTPPGNGPTVTGTQAAYISNNNGVSYAYTMSPTAYVVHMYRDIAVPATGTTMVSFDLKVQGETTYDYLRVVSAATSFTPVAGTLPTGTTLYQSTLVSGATGYTRVTATLPAATAGTTVRLIFTWRNDTSGGTQPPAAVDNILVQSFNCLAPTAPVISNNTTGNSATLAFTAAANSADYTVTLSPATATTYNNVSSPVSLTGLAAATTYTVSVRSNCTAGVGGGQSPALTTTFTTPSQPANFTTARNTGVAYTSIATTGTSFPSFQASSLLTDDNVSATVPLTAGSTAAGATAFAFNYLGLNVQGFQISTNGFLTFNTANTLPAFTNNLSLISPNLVLAPFWDDLVTQGNPSGNGGTTAAINASLASSMKYQVSGTAPNRKLTVEWIGMEVYQNPGPSLNFQVILTETANTIEYRYGEMSGFDGSNNYSYSYSLGMNGVTAATPNTYLAQDVANSNYFLQNNASVAAPSTITATTTLTAAQRGNSLSIVPACNSNIVFTPAASFTPNLPPAAAVPTNDDPAGATTLALGASAPTDFCAVYSSANATATASIPVCTAATAGTPDDDVWFQFVVPATSNVTVTLRSSGTYDGVLQVFSDAGVTAVACLNATGAGLTETYTATGLAAGTYYVRVYEAGTGSAYNGAFVLAAYATPTPPANDECAGAITLPSNATTCTPVSGTTLAATASAGITACNATIPGTPDDDVWYKFTTGSTAVNDYNITLQGASGFDGVLQLFSGSCGALVPQGCLNSTSTGGAEAAVTNGLTANTTYYLRVYHTGAGTGSGNFTLCVYRSCNPPASVAAGSITATSANITFTNGGSGNFTVTATPATGSPVTATGTTGTTPGIALTGLVQGTTYSVVVQGDCGAGATSTAVSFTTITPPPANDECAGAIGLTSGTTCTTTTGSTISATASTAAGTCAGTADDDVWYSFVATNTQHTITVVGNASFDAVVNLRSGTCPGTTVGSCADASAGGGTETIAATGLTVGATYFVRVFSYSSTAPTTAADGGFTICVTNPAACAAPTTVTAGSVTTTSASITFSGGNGNTGYSVTATPTTGSPVTATGAASPIALTGLTASTTYSVVVTGNCGAAGASTAVSFTTLSPPPANDECAGAIGLTSGTTCTTTTGSTIGATSSTAAGTCAGTADDDVWYSFVATNTQHTITVVGNASFDAVVNLRSGTCPGTTVGSCADASAGGGTETITATTLTVGQTYYVRVYSYSSTAPTTAATGGFTICIAQPGDLVVNTGNSPYSASGTFNNVTIASGGTANLSADLTVLGTLTINDGGTLNTAGNQVLGTGNFVLQAGGTLGIRGTAGITTGPATTGVIRNTGATRSFSNDASYVYNGTAAQVTGSGLPATVRNITVNNSTGLTLSQALSVRQLVSLQSGNLATGGNTFTLLSVAGQGTALIDNTGGVVTGTGTMQRAIDVTNPAGIGYRHYSAPVSNTTVGDLQTTGYTPVLNSAYNTSASPGAVSPFPTVFGYDETRIATATNNLGAFDKGWFSPTATTDAMTVAQGYTANVADGALIDLVGTFNSGAVNRTGLTRGSNADAGWHLLGNPYPSPLNWDLVDNNLATNLPGMDAAVYVYQSSGQYTGSYRSYVNGVGNPLIDAGQGYFARVTTAGTPGSVNLTNAHRVTTFVPQPTFGRGTADTRPLLTLTLNGNGQADETTVYFEAGASSGTDAQFDAVKRLNMGTVSLASLLNAQDFAINGLPLLTSQDVVVPLVITNALAGSYRFDAATVRSFGSTTVWLRDATTGTQVNLSQGSSYNFSLAANAGGSRFSLVFRPGTVTATHAGIEAAQMLLFPNPAHGSFTVSVPSVANARTVQATLLNALGQKVLTRTLPLGTTGAVAEFSTANLAAGVYMMQIRAGESLVTKRVVVD